MREFLSGNLKYLGIILVGFLGLKRKRKNMLQRLLGYNPTWIFFGLFAAACAPDEQVSRTDATRGKGLFDASCVQCHGSNGEGSIAAFIELDPPAPSLRVLSKNNGGVFPSEYVMTTIDGLSRHNQKVASMPEFGENYLGPLIQIENDGVSTPIPADLLALANYLEAIQD